MTTTRRLILLIILAALGSGLGAALAGAAPPATLEQARARIAAARQQKATLSDQIGLLDGELAAIDKRLASLGDKIGVVEAKLSTTREKLELLQDQLRLKRLELEKAERRLAAEEASFELRIVLAYKTDDLSYVDVVLDSTSFEDLISRINVVSDFIAGDNALVGDLATTRDGIAREKRAIAEKEEAVHAAVADLQQQSDELAELRAARAAEQDAALAMRKEKDGKLRAVETDLAELERQEAQLLAESNSLSGVINGASGAGGGTGDLAWPVSGPVTSPFGWRVHPIFGVRKFHTGIDIGIGYGVPIHAADSGTVIYATWMSGYGNVTIIDHGGGISTLYAHQSSFAVSGGATVGRGQVIGAVGSTGYSTGPHLHFEVRLNGVPVDPLAYL
ncbi:MAG: peptidoglycan DD-metalloendopeptidase family protein [Thermoleophilia bacterium]